MDGHLVAAGGASAARTAVAGGGARASAVTRHDDDDCCLGGWKVSLLVWKELFVSCVVRRSLIVGSEEVVGGEESCSLY